MVMGIKFRICGCLGNAVLWSGLTAPAAAAAEEDAIVLGAAVSLTGKYSIDGKNTKD
jgi:branched-chain amino acid transport system substrate-binding protein